jgi:hypothetical protein
MKRNNKQVFTAGKYLSVGCYKKDGKWEVIDFRIEQLCMYAFY